MRSVLPWSWSSYDSYQTCPFKHYHTKVAKTYIEPDTQPLIWGNEVHQAVEYYITQQRAVPATMQRFLPIVDKIISGPGDVHAELELACRSDLSACGFWDDDAWCRGKGDVVRVNGKRAFNGDWKTGKWKAASLQLDLAAVMTFALFEEVELVHTAFIYFQEPSRPVIKSYTWDQVPQIMAQDRKSVV